MPSLTEYDDTVEAIIEPARVIRHRDLPRRCVVTFFSEVIEKIPDVMGAELLPPIKSEMGEIPVLRSKHEGVEVGILQGAVGAPLAAGCLEEAIARGARSVVVCGGAGVIDSSLPAGHVILPTSALRDEGTSYHYLPASRTVHPTRRVLDALRAVLVRHACPYSEGMTWTTDAYYRETPAKVERRRMEGCICVEMEAAAYYAVAQFRGIELGQILYSGDDVGGKNWDPRNSGGKTSARGKLFWLAVEACASL